MAGEVDYIALLKCACDLKQRIDELVNKNPEEISTKTLIFNFGYCVLMYINLIVRCMGCKMYSTRN